MNTEEKIKEEKIKSLDLWEQLGKLSDAEIAGRVEQSREYVKQILGQRIEGIRKTIKTGDA